MRATINVQTIMQQVRGWPVDKRLVLAQEILHTLRSEFVETEYHKDTLDIALGLLATDQPGPTDETVHQWVCERRIEKYG